MNEISTLISSLGFPIVCCIAMFYQNEKLRQTIDENTKAITKMIEKLEEEHKAHE